MRSGFHRSGAFFSTCRALPWALHDALSSAHLTLLRTLLRCFSIGQAETLSKSWRSTVLSYEMGYRRLSNGQHGYS